MMFVYSTIESRNDIVALGGLITLPKAFCCDRDNATVVFDCKSSVMTHILLAPGNPNPEVLDFHINNVNVYHGKLKESLGRFHGVAIKTYAMTLAGRAPSRPGERTLPKAAYS